MEEDTGDKTTDEARNEFLLVQFIKNNQIISLVVVGILVLWIISAFIVAISFSDWPSRGQFGDMFGAINALFSGLALGGVILAIFLQKEELTAQREELSLTRDEFKIQNTTLKKQAFENTFFQLLRQHHEIIDKLTIKKGSEHILKRETLEFAHMILLREIEGSLINFDTTRIDENTIMDTTKKLIIDSYKPFFNAFHNNLGHYFRNLYHIFKFIYFSDMDKKQFYASLIRAQLSSNELTLLLYNSLIPDCGYPNFLFLMKEYDILQNLNYSDTPGRTADVFDYELAHVGNPFINEMRNDPRPKD